MAHSRPALALAFQLNLVIFNLFIGRFPVKCRSKSIATYTTCNLSSIRPNLHNHDQISEPCSRRSADPPPCIQRLRTCCLFSAWVCVCYGEPWPRLLCSSWTMGAVSTVLESFAITTAMTAKRIVASAANSISVPAKAGQSAQAAPGALNL